MWANAFTPLLEIIIFVPKAGYFTIPNVMFKFNFLAVVVGKIFIPEESTLPHLIVFLISTF